MNRTTTGPQLTGGLAGTAFLLGNILCWSAVPVLLRYLTDSIDAWTANGFRFPLAAFLYWPILTIAWRRGNLDISAFQRCIVPSIFALGGQVLWALAPYYLPASAISFFMRFSLLFAFAAAMIFFADERKLLTLPRFYAGVALLFGGFILMSISKVQFDEEVTTLGIVIILGCGTFFGFYSVSVRHFLRGIHPIVGFGIVSNYVSLATLTGMFTLGNYSQLLDLSLRNLLVLSGSAVLGIAMGHFFLYSAVSRLGAAITAGGQTLIPFPTMLLASWILHESMTGLEWVAGLTMVVGAALLLLVQNQVVEASRRQLRTAEPSTAKS